MTAGHRKPDHRHEIPSRPATPGRLSHRSGRTWRPTLGTFDDRTENRFADQWTGRAGSWTVGQVSTAAVAIAVAIAIRLVLLPTEGFRGDIDQFVVWVRHITTNGLPNAYDQNLTFGPVMAYIWGILGLVEPGFRSATDASDAWLRALMKVPASLADLGLAAGVAYALRARPTWALVGALVMLLHPAVWYVSAWWGQYESIYVLAVLVATVLAINGRSGFAAAFLAVALMTKPQALPLLVPFAAWFYAREGPVGLVRAVFIGGAVGLVLWLPFIPAGGPLAYVGNLNNYQSDIFSVLSVRAWNAWWLVQEVAGGGNFIADNVTILGPFTLRHAGYIVVGVLEIAIGAAIIRNPRPRTLILGLAASVLVVFSFATQMHERYAYGAVVFLTLLVAEPRARWLGLAFGVVFTANLVAAIPATPDIGRLLPVAGALGFLGSIAMLGITWAVLRMMVAGPTDLDVAPAPPRHSRPIRPPSVARVATIEIGTRPSTNAGSAGATSAT